MTEISKFRTLSLTSHSNVFVITMQKAPENRLNSWYCQEIIRAFHAVHRILGPDSEGAVEVMLSSGALYLNWTKELRILLPTQMDSTRYFGPLATIHSP
ncbi:hypothetical protein RJZ56_006698 [Blastomyces dermatitidis]|uniref:Uncharacterized protein n=2 Tax=Ajellomyces dermatitidis TaxID=5039 RepID=F2TTH8_AJEDA|nr:uncharacterized protein BDCG_17538 [Blastomyces dermatitidis ER-3]EGE86541.1 hypothetical protein BDDG_09486 [Blastomyces dermatitidis ATCC 18188]OAT02417.1 hypothetical protein BDCG_17538 [Blastomyces dermatitidis ER-3]